MTTRKDWFHINKNGLRIGWMDPVIFETQLTAFYGEKGWVNAFCADFDVSPPTVYRYAQGLQPIPKVVAKAVLMLSNYASSDEVPEVEAPWLPESTRFKYHKDSGSAAKGSKGGKAKDAA